MNEPMKRFSRSVLTVVAWLVLMSAAQGATESERFDPVPAFPDAWGRRDSTKLQDGCPDVSGSYKLVPEVYEAKRENSRLESIVGKRGDFIGIFIHPRRISAWTSVSRVKTLSPPVSEEKLAITLEQPSTNEFNLTYYSFDGRREFRVLFDRSQNDFVCKDGYIEISFKPVEEHAEGRTYRIDAYRRFTRMADGALLFYEQHRTWSREALVFTKSETRHRYYRFSPMDSPR